ncbi:MAG: hypothetical protein JOZ36_09420, partial [Acidobacteria bacterium]|nr:hypothetical protein [Acidobacteriota bacterium]
MDTSAAAQMRDIYGISMRCTDVGESNKKEVRTNKIIKQVYIGESRALNPDKYFIIIVNQIGNGLSTSPHNTPAPAGMGNFPHVRIGDD